MKNSRAQALVQLVDEVQEMSDDDAYTQYGIELFVDGTVADVVENIVYSSITKWAETQFDSIQEATFEKRQQPSRYDD